MRLFIRSFLFVLAATFAYETQKQAMVYVLLGDDAEDKAGRDDLKVMEARLNLGAEKEVLLRFT